jgi:hypothetical protein
MRGAHQAKPPFKAIAHVRRVLAGGFFVFG